MTPERLEEIKESECLNGNGCNWIREELIAEIDRLQKLNDDSVTEFCEKIDRLKKELEDQRKNHLKEIKSIREDYRSFS